MKNDKSGILTTIGTGIAVIGLMWIMLSSMESRLNARIDGVEARLDSMESRFELRLLSIEEHMRVTPPKH